VAGGLLVILHGVRVGFTVLQGRWALHHHDRYEDTREMKIYAQNRLEGSQRRTGVLRDLRSC
jgi:hypothetical protein